MRAACTRRPAVDRDPARPIRSQRSTLQRPPLHAPRPSRRRSDRAVAVRPERRREPARQQSHRHRPSGHRAPATHPTSAPLQQGWRRRPSPVLPRPRRQRSRRPRLTQPWLVPPVRLARLMLRAPPTFPPRRPSSWVPTSLAHLALLVPLVQLVQLVQLARNPPILQQPWQQAPEWASLPHQPMGDRQAMGGHQATTRRPTWCRSPPSWAACSRAGVSAAGGMPAAMALACRA